MSKLTKPDILKYFLYTDFYKDIRFYYPVILNAFFAFLAVLNSWDFGVVIVLFGISKSLPLATFLIKFNFLSEEQKKSYYYKFGDEKNLAKENTVTSTVRGIIQVFFILLMIAGMLFVSTINHDMIFAKLYHWSFLLALFVMIIRHLISIVLFFKAKNRMKHFSKERQNHMVIYDIIIVFIIIMLLFIPTLKIVHFYLIVTVLELMFYLIYKAISTYSCPICNKFSSEEYFDFNHNEIKCSKCGFKFPIKT